MVIHGSENVTKEGCLIEFQDDTAETVSLAFKIQILRILKEKDCRWILCLIIYNSVIIYYLCSWVASTNSLALKAYTNTVIFNIFSLVVCFISVWVRRNISEGRKLCAPSPAIQSSLGHSRSRSASGYPQYGRSFAAYNPRHSISGPCLNSADPEEAKNGSAVIKAFDASILSVLGLEKYEVLALLVSSCLALMAASLVSMEAFGRIADQPTVHTGRFGLGVLLGVAAHLVTISVHRDAGLEHVVCKALPCPTLKGYNPILGGNILGAVIIYAAYILVHWWDVYAADTAAAFAVIGLGVTSMLPLAFYTAGIILQRLPHHMAEQLDKCLREALVIDGVLEFRNERFWTKSFGKLAGSLQVRMRRDADESHVLETVVGRLSRIVSTLTVQEFRETRVPFRSGEHCPEYYINELLPDFEAERTPGAVSPKEIDEDVRVMKIDDVLGVEPSAVETASTASGTRKPVEREGLTSIETPKTLTIYRNDNVPLRNYLYRGSNGRSALFAGANFEVADERFRIVSPN